MTQPNSLPPLDVPSLLKRYGLRPDKRLGQNFLTDPVHLEQVVDAAQVGSEDAVLEIGPGLGSLTRLLAQRARKVVAVEIDEKLLPPLKEVLAPFSNVVILQGDILTVNPVEWISAMEMEQGPESPSYIVAANIPYYITSAIMRHLLEISPQPERMALTVQEEVAERICADPGDLSLLALSVQVYGEPKIAARIPAGAFYPAPNVDSAVVRIDIYKEPRIPFSLLDEFFLLAKAGFSQKRKTLRNALAGGMRWSPARTKATLQAAGIDPMRRAETLSLEEWGTLTRQVAEEGL